MFRPAIIVFIAAAAACGGSPDYDARALDVPFIDQYEPAGAGPQYDGSMYCGPALLAGIAKAERLFPGTADAARARPVSVRAGQTTAATDFVVDMTGASSISGSVFDSMGKPALFPAAGVSISTRARRASSHRISTHAAASVSV